MDADRIGRKQITIVGGARSGRAAARLLAGTGARVFLTERGPAPTGLEAELKQWGVQFEWEGHTERALEADFLVLSPGVPSTSELVVRAGAQGLPVYSEVEVASWFCKAPIVAVTGANGKTTTTSLLGHMFRCAGRPCLVAGNIGVPFSEHVETLGADHVVVLEVSSFQLDHIDSFRPQVSILLNITPDHLDRYASFEAYARSKYRIFENQTVGDTAVYNVDDERVRRAVESRAAIHHFDTLGFSQEEELSSGAFVRQGSLMLRYKQNEETLMQVEQLALRGRHNLYNSLAAAVATRVMDIRNDVIRESLMTFEGVPHRLELVREKDGVRFVNDSKATNVNAVWYALESFNSPIVLIVGGRDKGNDYTMIKDLVRERVRAVIAIGESGDKVMEELGALIPHACRVFSMQEAVDCGAELAQPGDVVLLSPACASFDMFRNFEERGDIFRQIVKSL